MKFEIILSIIFLIASCKQQGSYNTINGKSSFPSSQPNTLDEEFDDFFLKFRKDSLFQVQRIDNPLSILLSDENSIYETKQVIKYVSFSQLDWDVNISYESVEVSKDTMNVILEGIDTGVYIEHIFVRRDNQWHLCVIKNFSD